MSIALLARNGFLPCMIAGIVLAGGVTLSGRAQDQRVTAAEAAAERLLPPEATIVGSQALAPSTAEVLAEFRGQLIRVQMQQTGSNGWQPDMSATLIQGAEDLQQLLAQEGPVASFGQAPAESLLDSTSASTTLIPPVNIEEATRRALDRAGRENPFQPLDVFVPPPAPTGQFPGGQTSLPPIAAPPPVELPRLPDPESASIPPTLATPTPDPAAFARTVAVTGIINIDGESFAFLNASGQDPAVVGTGDTYQSAQVTQISPQDREVVLSEGGQFVSKEISASVLTEAP